MHSTVASTRLSDLKILVSRTSAVEGRARTTLAGRGDRAGQLSRQCMMSM